MADAATLRSTRRAVDDAALARIRARLAGADEPPWLHAEVARRMVDRLPIFRQQPRRILDWYGHDRASAPLLATACRGARVQRVDPLDLPAQAPSTAAPWWSPRRWRAGRGDPLLPAAALPPAEADMLWAHMGLHWCADPLAEMRRWHAALAVDGLLMFSTVGPGTLPSLRALAAARGWPPLCAPLVDMHDLGDMLVEAGFAEPVMDQETLTLHWADAPAMLAELRTLGGNAHPQRHAGLRTPRWKRELLTALTPADGSRPAMVFEVVYGHAVRGRPRTPVAQETRVALDDMRSILRR
jgi:malonyl-CoA O-methyltransferase